MTGVRDEDEVYITVCAENEEQGDEFEFEIEFESDPKPDKITWFMQDAVGRRETVKEVSIKAASKEEGPKKFGAPEKKAVLL